MYISITNPFQKGTNESLMKFKKQKAKIPSAIPMIKVE